jgi:hypothetical protein
VQQSYSIAVITCTVLEVHTLVGIGASCTKIAYLFFIKLGIV